MALENSLRFLASSRRSLGLGFGFGARDLKMLRRWRFDGRRAWRVLVRGILRGFWCAGFEDVTALAFRREAGLEGYQLVVGIVDIRYLAGVGSAVHRQFSQKLIDQKVVETFRGFLIGRDPRGPVDVFSTEESVSYINWCRGTGSRLQK